MMNIESITKVVSKSISVFVLWINQLKVIWNFASQAKHVLDTYRTQLLLTLESNKPFCSVEINV